MKIAVLGLGVMGNLYVRILTDLLGAENVVGVEVDPERRAALATELGVEVVADWRPLVGQVDAVAVTLPDHLHVDPAVAFLQQGSYVMVEKPLATSLEDCQRILDAQVAPGRLMVAQLLRFDPRNQELKRRLDAGEFGTLRYVRIWRTNSTAGAARVGSRVSVSAFLGVHDLDLLQWLTGQEVVSATAAGRKFFGPHWDLTVATVELQDGTFALVENHWLLHPSAQRSNLSGVQVFGENGMALLDLSTQELEVVSDAAPQSKRVDTHNWTFDSHLSGGALRREVEAFVTAARDRTAVPVSGEDGARAVRAVLIVEAALAEGSR
jgi:predicted dehydrogenase